ncbi:MAG: NADH-quinone oxidoreductase subunit M [Gammaproteobacteria bacterium]|nr:NADH-quinone oxidoreductase subunit M [Gammaproteobacteria bacterium]
MQEIIWSQQPAYPVLAALQLLPLLGAVIVYGLRERAFAATLGRAFAAAELFIAIDLYRRFDAVSPLLQFAERLNFPGALDYHAAADGITVVFILTTALLTLLVSVYSLVRGLPDLGRLLAVVLAIESVIMSLLTSQNLLWFVLASTAELGLIGYMLWRWSNSAEKDRALRRFYQFHGTGVLLLLIGTLLAGNHHADFVGGHASYELADLVVSTGKSERAGVIFILLFVGLAIRAPLFPFHGWLPVVTRHGNIAMAPAFLLGIKVGIYGMIRFILPMLPAVSAQARGVILGAALAGIFYAALLAFQQTNLRRLLAFAVVSHTSLLAIGIFTLEPEALEGAVLLAVTFGLAATAMLFMVGLVYRRTGSTQLSRLGGLFDRLPAIALTFFVGGLAIVCMPGTPGFDAAHLIFESAIHRFGALATLAAALGNVVAAGFLLWAFQRAFLAPAPAGRAATVERTSPMEWFIALVVVTVLLVAGFYTNPWFDLVDAPMRALGQRLGTI